MSNVFSELDADWRHFQDRPDVRQFVERLNGDIGEHFTGAGDLVSEIRTSGHRDPERADDLLLAVLLYGEADHVAQRIVLQALLPGLCVISRRLAIEERTSMLDELGPELVSLAGLRIATYPLERRPTRIAANVLRDVARDFARNRHRRRREIASIPIPGDEAGPRVAFDPSDARAAVPFEHLEARLALTHELARALDAGVILPRDFEFLVWTRVAGRDIESIASRHDVVPESARRARDRAERRLARFCTMEQTEPAAIAAA